jgi:hypothetical protein
MALMGLVYRDKLFPLQAYARAFEVMLERIPSRAACRIMVDLLALADERACEAELAKQLSRDLDDGRLPDMKAVRALFAPDAASLPDFAARADKEGWPAARFLVLPPRSPGSARLRKS